MEQTWTFGTARISFSLDHYTNDATSVQAWELEDELFAAPYARISINIPEVPILPEGQFFLKHWSENAPIAHEMEAQGLIERVQPPVMVHLQFTTTQAYEFTDKGKQFISQE